MNTQQLAAILTLVVGSALATTANAFTYDEALDGDLSGNRLSPTSLTATTGSNLLSATSVAGDLEYFTFTVGAGLQLSALELVSFTGDDVSFGAVQAGSVFTEEPATVNVANLLGWTHFLTADIGTDILDDMGAGPGAIGFTGALPAGAYTFWFQETGGIPVDYTLDFQISVVPVPAAVWLFGSALGVLGWMRRRVSG